MRKAPEELHEFLEAFPPNISKLFLEIRRAILGAAPDASELIYNAYNAVSAAYSFTGGLKEAFCHVAAYPAHVNLGFNRGAELRDPTRVLVGSGARIRHIRISSLYDLRSRALNALLRAAVAQGRVLASGAVPRKPSSSIRPTTGAKRRPKRTW
ncbi:MAG TPA: DUF1801 domain-containing protein [Burkholderiales bacterium]|nr:DUF1801 domain-containing protein [Burkholderiales bacterium]